MNDGLITFESVRDWEARECQRHICEIQGLALPQSIRQFEEPGSFPRRICTGNPTCQQNRNLEYGGGRCGFDTEHQGTTLVGDQRHICEIQGRAQSLSIFDIQGPVLSRSMRAHQIWGAGLVSAPKLTDLHQEIQHVNLCKVDDWDALECQRHIRAPGT